MLTWRLLANAYSLGGLTDRVRWREGGLGGVMGTRKVILLTAATAAPAAASVAAVVDSSALDAGVGLVLVDRRGDSGLRCSMLTAGLGVSGLRVAVLVADLSPSLHTLCVELAKTLATGSVASS